MVKRIFALALSVVLTCGLVPAAAFALPEQSDDGLLSGGDLTAVDVSPGALSMPSVAALARYNYPDGAGARAAAEDGNDLALRFDLREAGTAPR